MLCGCLDVVRRQAVSEMRSDTSPSLAVKNSASPKGWSQKWAHELSTTANYSGISTSKALSGLPWAQGVAGSNPVAPTIFRGSILSGSVTVSSRFLVSTVPPLSSPVPFVEAMKVAATTSTTARSSPPMFEAV